MERTQSVAPNPFASASATAVYEVMQEVKIVQSLVHELIARVSLLDHEQKTGFETIQKKLQDTNDKSIIHMHDIAATVLFPPKVPAPVPVEGEPRPALKIVPETSKMSKELQDELFKHHNMNNLRSQTDEELRAMWEALNFHIQRLEEEITLTSDEAARQQKILDKRKLKDYKQDIREFKYQKKHLSPHRKDVYWQVLKAYLVMDNFQDSLLADRTELEAKTQDAEERQMHVTAINQDIEEIKKYAYTLTNIAEYLHEE